MYEASAGHNTALIIDFAPKPDGSLPTVQVTAAAALGSYISACYGSPVAQTAANASVVPLALPAPTSIDRVLVAEVLALGQLVRAFSVSATLANGTVAVLAAGSSVGGKFIAVFPAVTAVSLSLNVTAVAAAGPAGAPYIAAFAAYSCDALIDAAAADLDSRGFPQPPRARTPAQRAAERAAEAAARAAHAVPHRQRRVRVR